MKDFEKFKTIEVSYWYKGASLGSNSYDDYKKLNKIAIDYKHIDTQKIYERLNEIANFIDIGVIKTFSEQTQNQLFNEWALGVLILLRNGYIKNNEQYGILKKKINAFGFIDYSF